MVWPGDQGWRSCESAFNSPAVPYVGWVCCWFSHCSEGFSLGSAVFLLSQKPTFPISNLITIEDPNENQLRLIISYCNFFLKFTSDSNRNRVKSKVNRIKTMIPSSLSIFQRKDTSWWFMITWKYRSKNKTKHCETFTGPLHSDTGEFNKILTYSAVLCIVISFTEEQFVMTNSGDEIIRSTGLIPLTMTWTKRLQIKQTQR